MSADTPLKRVQTNRAPSPHHFPISLSFAMYTTKSSYCLSGWPLWFYHFKLILPYIYQLLRWIIIHLNGSLDPSDTTLPEKSQFYLNYSGEDWLFILGFERFIQDFALKTNPVVTLGKPFKLTIRFYAQQNVKDVPVDLFSASS